MRCLLPEVPSAHHPLIQVRMVVRSLEDSFKAQKGIYADNLDTWWPFLLQEPLYSREYMPFFCKTILCFLSIIYPSTWRMIDSYLLKKKLLKSSPFKLWNFSSLSWNWIIVIYNLEISVKFLRLQAAEPSDLHWIQWILQIWLHFLEQVKS